MRKVMFKVTTLQDDSCIIQANSKYQRHYPDGKTVRATKGTLGIMVFDTKKDAMYFLSTQGTRASLLKVKRVIPIGRGKRPQGISFFCGALRLDSFYLENINSSVIPPPEGTICYPAVKVINDCKRR